MATGARRFGYSRWKNDEFLGAISHWFASRFHSPIDHEAIVYGPSVIYMVAEMIRQWSNSGDGIVVHTPAYDAFYKTIDGNQRRIAPVALKLDEGEWRCDMNELEAALARPDNRILLLCSPHNPTGKVWSRDELTTMAQLCAKHNVRVISDEIHMDMTWGEHRHTPGAPLRRAPGRCSRRAQKLQYPGIYRRLWAHRRYCFARWLSASAERSRWSLITFGSGAGRAYRRLSSGRARLDALRDYLQENMRYIAGQLNQAFPQLRWQPPQATYLAWIDLRPLGVDDRALQRALIEEQKSRLCRVIPMAKRVMVSSG